MNTQWPRWLGLLVRDSPHLLLQSFNRDCCIAATRVAVEVSKRLGFEARAQTTQLRVWNKKLFERIQAEGFDGKFRDGEWSVGIGFGEDPRYANPEWKGFDGHLVAVVEERFLVDLSFGQTSRPKKDMPTLPALAVAMRNDGQPWPACVVSERFTCVYDPIDNSGYLKSPDWTDEERTEQIIEQIIETIKQ